MVEPRLKIIMNQTGSKFQTASGQLNIFPGHPKMSFLTDRKPQKSLLFSPALKLRHDLAGTAKTTSSLLPQSRISFSNPFWCPVTLSGFCFPDLILRTFNWPVLERAAEQIREN